MSGPGSGVQGRAGQCLDYRGERAEAKKVRDAVRLQKNQRCGPAIIKEGQVGQP